MMTEVFIGSIAFSIGLLALTGGVWLTNTSGSKVIGLIISGLAILSLVFTSYNVANFVFMQNNMKQMMAQMQQVKMKHDKKIHDKIKGGEAKAANTNSNN